jgi:hypothetical protein
VSTTVCPARARERTAATAALYFASVTITVTPSPPFIFIIIQQYINFVNKISTETINYHRPIYEGFGAKANKAIAERERILSLYADAYMAAKNAVDTKRTSGDVKTEKTPTQWTVQVFL